MPIIPKPHWPSVCYTLCPVMGRCVHLTIQGRVQGVGFRASAQGQGRALGLLGWVRNRDDGGVEALAQGDDEAVDRFVAWCRVGPRAARVSAVVVEDQPLREDARGFEVVS